MTIETINDQLVGVQGDAILVLAPKNRMTPDEALRQAAWLVALAEHDATHPFADVLTAVQNT